MLSVAVLGLADVGRIVGVLVRGSCFEQHDGGALPVDVDVAQQSAVAVGVILGRIGAQLGSIPKMIFDVFCNAQPIFTFKIFD